MGARVCRGRVHDLNVASIVGKTIKGQTYYYLRVVADHRRRPLGEGPRLGAGPPTVLGAMDAISEDDLKEIERRIVAHVVEAFDVALSGLVLDMTNARAARQPPGDPRDRAALPRRPRTTPSPADAHRNRPTQQRLYHLFGLDTYAPQR